MSNLIAHWAAPPNVRALTTTRSQGVSQAPYDHNNLALHVGDNPCLVKQNRSELSRSLQLVKEPIWLEQIHSNLCVVVEEDQNRVADATITRCINTPLVIMTADCLPILLCNRSGTEIAAIHAGWKGLAHGIIENTLMKMHSPPETVIAWIGPAICLTCYETSQDLQTLFIEHYPYTKKTFQNKGSKCFTNLPKIAELVLNAQGVTEVYQSKACSFEHEHDFYSYRREAQTGRMASLIWIEDTRGSAKQVE